MSPPAAFICGLSGWVLEDDERQFIKEADPLGFILFSRNCDNPAQVKSLITELRDAVGRESAPVLIDQEGGRVARLAEPNWWRPPAAARIAELWRDNQPLALEAAKLHHGLIGAQCADLGVDVVCTPVLDLPQPGAHPVIGDRAWGAAPDQVIALAGAAITGLSSQGVAPVIKHLPGHGRAAVDSHETVPVVDASIAAMRLHDFRAFSGLRNSPWGMTAHVIFSDIDDRQPATLSPAVITDVIRGEIGFDGLLVSDDLSMKALSGPIRVRAASALSAGCDIALHCNGEIGEMREVAAGVARLSTAAQERLDRASAIKRIAGRERFDFDANLGRLEAILGDSEKRDPTIK